MGIFDRSRSTTNLTEQNYQEILNQEAAQSEISGLGVNQVGGNVEIAIDQVDSGVVAAARDLGGGALAVSGDIAALAIRSSGEASIESARSSAETAQRSVTTVAGIASDSIDAQNRTIEYALQQSGTIARDTISTLSGAITSASDATRSDAANVLNNLVKYGALVAAAIAGYMIFRRARA
jgi:hypothetical protein